MERIEPQDDFEVEMLAKGLPKEMAIKAIENHRDRKEERVKKSTDFKKKISEIIDKRR